MSQNLLSELKGGVITPQSLTALDPTEVKRLIALMTPLEQERLLTLLQSQPKPLWEPLPGPQTWSVDNKADELFAGGRAGGGKALSLDTPLPTPDGWITMDTVQMGDLLLDEWGLPCHVLAVSEVMYDHVVYEVVFDDGSTIKADADHQWLTFDYRERLALHTRTDEFRARKNASRPSRSRGVRPYMIERNRVIHPPTLPPPVGTVHTTQTIYETLIVREDRVNHAIRVAAPLQLASRALAIHPYVLGVWLGDGNSYGCGLTCADDPILDTIQSLGYTIRKRPSGELAYGILGIQESLRKLSLLGNKYIPREYLRADETQRRWLLAGLMDTDGTALPSGACEFYSTNRHLAYDVWELLQTLGIKCSVGVGRATLRGKDCGEKYRIKFTTAVPVFELPRKRERQVSEERGTQRWRYIVDVRPVESESVKCVVVDSPSHLYLAGVTMVPTHNSDLLLGLAITHHRKSIIFRKEYKQLKDLMLRSREILGATKATFNQMNGLWRGIPPHEAILEFGAISHDNDLGKYRGREHDGKFYDEVTELPMRHYQFINAWLRSKIPGQRTRIVATGNPPSTSDGEWVIEYWGPWLNPQYPHPAQPDELRWFAMVDNRRVERENGDPFEHKGEIITPRSLSFIPASLADNPYLASTGYASVLQNLPEPYRSQLLHGDFRVGYRDNPWQVIPTEWVEAAMERWKNTPQPQGEMEALGVDPAHGGIDQSVLAPRWGKWFGELVVEPGARTPDGQSVAILVARVMHNSTYVAIDSGPWGTAAYEALRNMENMRVVGINFGEWTDAVDKTGRLRFSNMRSCLYWQMREALDPQQGESLCLPPDPELLSDLTAPRWNPRGGRVYIESKQELKYRLGRSPDRGDAVVLAWGGTVKSFVLTFA